VGSAAANISTEISAVTPSENCLLRIDNRHINVQILGPKPSVVRQFNSIQRLPGCCILGNPPVLPTVRKTTRAFIDLQQFQPNFCNCTRSIGGIFIIVLPKLVENSTRHWIVTPRMPGYHRLPIMTIHLMQAHYSESDYGVVACELILNV